MEAALSINRQENVKAASDFREKVRAAKLAIVTDYRGLTVTEMTRLRREIRQASGEYRVIKNTLARLAVKDTPYERLGHLLEGPNGWVFGYDDPVGVSKVLIRFSEENEKLKIKVGLIEGELLDRARVKLLAQMPGRAELQARLLALIEAPVVRLLRVVQEPAARMVRLLDALAKQRSGS